MINKNHIFVLQFIAFLIYIITTIAENNINILLFYLLLLFIGLFFKKEKELYLCVYNASAIIGILFYYSLLNYYGEPYYVGGSDDKMYELWSLDILYSEKWYDPVYITENGYLPFGHNSPLYVVILSFLRIICSVFDTFHTIIPKLFNAALLASSSCLVFRISKNFFKEKNSKIIAFVYGLYPIVLSIANYTFRDTLIAFLFVVVIYLAEKTKLNLLSFSFTLLIVVIISFLMFYLRELYVPVLISIFIIRCYMRRENITSLKLTTIIILFVILIFVTQFFDISHSQLEKKFANYTTYRAEELSSGFGKILFNLPLFPLGIFFRYFYLLMPFNVFVEFSSAFFVFGSIVQYFCVPFFLYGSYLVFKTHKSFQIYIAFTHLILIMISITSFTWRHLTIIYPFFIMIIIETILLTNKKKIYNIVIFTTIFLSILFMTYMILKMIEN
jgi:hypothetical protein